MPKSAHVITAIGTPLDEQENLHQEGLERHLADQWSAGIDGILVAGSMGVMQMLRDRTYRALVERASQLSRDRGEILVGVGDAGWARTCDRIEAVSQYVIDGVVVLTPYLFQFSQQQLVEYFLAIADVSPVPVYLYDLPVLTGAALEFDTYVAVARHPNIRGAKVSGRLAFARELMQHFGDGFRIIVAEPDKVDTLLSEGIMSHLDGMFAIAPQWIMKITSAAAEQDWARAADYQRKLNTLRDALLTAPSDMGAFTAMMNARDIPGKFHPAPYPALDTEARRALVSSPIMCDLLESGSAARKVIA
ncbi:MAG TPA: dihydrodipicolinate synthase family protein [Pirellulales bacterium]|nr:dihydrodipicolinate synthase family protein [Pirellulales bacterium]